MAIKVRSPFWVVSTHVLTTGVAMPFVAGAMAFAAIGALGMLGVPAWLLTLAFDAGGYIGGTSYSLNYVRKEATLENWSACTIPSIITFAIMALLRLAFDIWRLPDKTPIFIVALVAFYIAIVVAFSVITRNGFASFDAAAKAPQPA